MPKHETSLETIINKENQENEFNTEKTFEIKEVLVYETFSCQYSPGCDCAAN